MRRLIEIATERRVTIIMMMTAIVLFGMVSLSRLNLNLLPDISYPTLTVRAELTGAAPVEIENLLTKPIEEAVGVVRNVRLVRSVSRSGQADVTIEFLWGTDMDMAGIDVRDCVSIHHLNLSSVSDCSANPNGPCRKAPTIKVSLPLPKRNTIRNVARRYDSKHCAAWQKTA
jgi:HAE1 family hydrophobic/amphiphilic exporter-1